MFSNIGEQNHAKIRAALGYKIKKGETAYRIWGSPLKLTKKKDQEQNKDKPADQSDVEKKSQYWPMCSLFNENQVEKLKDDAQETGQADIAEVRNVENSVDTTDVSPFVTADYAERIETRQAALIIGWYQAHLQKGGLPDPVAEDLIAETQAEDRAGQSFSHPPGKA